MLVSKLKPLDLVFATEPQRSYFILSITAVNKITHLFSIRMYCLVYGKVYVEKYYDDDVLGEGSQVVRDGKFLDV